MNIRTLGVICGVLSGFFWGTMDIAAQYLLHTVRMAPAQFISLTMVVTTVALFGISLATRPKETFLAAADKQNVFQFFLFGVLVLLTQVSFYVCVKYSNAETAAVIAATRPFCIMGLLLFAAVMPTASQIFCCALALIGVCLMMTKGNFSTLSFGWLTLLVGFGAPLFSAAYTIQSRTIVRKVGPLIAMTWAMLFTTILCLLLGYPVALILSGRDFKRPGLWLMLIILPMWMNFLLRTYSWMSILENSGILNSWIASLRDAIPAFDRWLTSMGVGKKIIFLYNENAVVLGMVYNYLSFMIMPIYTVIEKTDHSLLEAAADLGASPVQSFLRVTLPYSLPGVLEGITMVFVPAVTTFVISQLMGGGKVPLIGDIIQNQFGKSSDWHFGSTLSLLVMVVVLAFMGGLQRIDKEEEPQKEVRIL